MSEIKKANINLLKQKLSEAYHLDIHSLDEWDYYFENACNIMNNCLNCKGKKECTNVPPYYQVGMSYTTRPQLVYKNCKYHHIDGPVTLYGMAVKTYDNGETDITKERAKFFNSEDQLLEDPLNSKGIALYGKFGTGKSYLMYHLCKSLAGKGLSCDLVYYPDLVSEVNQCIKENTLESRINEFKNVDVLLLDDVGAGLNTAYVRDNVLNSILQERMNNKKLTLMTTNCDKNSLISFFEDTKDSSDHLKAVRLVAWMESMMDFIELGGKDYRTQ